MRDVPDVARPNLKTLRKERLPEFLSDNNNIWQAAKYLKSGKDVAFKEVPQLVRTDGSCTLSTKEQAEELLTSFFPPLPDNIEDEGFRPLRTAVPMPDLSMEEIKHQLNIAKSWKAPGEDRLPVAVWKRVWPAAKDRVLALFQVSLRE